MPSLSPLSPQPSRPIPPPESTWTLTLPDGGRIEFTGRDADFIREGVQEEIAHYLAQSAPSRPPLGTLKERAQALAPLMAGCRPLRMEGENAIVQLALSFPTLGKAPIRPWRSKTFARWLADSPAVTSGSYWAGRFVLSVYYGGDRLLTTDYPKLGLVKPLGGFDVSRAFAAWDDDHRAAFLAWALRP